LRFLPSRTTSWSCRRSHTLERFLGDGEDARERAIVAFSALVGGIVLSRAVDDDALSDEILRAVRAGLGS
jgi:hypothetical protein